MADLYYTRLYCLDIVDMINSINEEDTFEDSYVPFHFNIINNNCVQHEEEFMDFKLGLKVSGIYPGTPILIKISNEFDPDDVFYGLLTNGGISRELTREEFMNLFEEELECPYDIMFANFHEEEY